MGKLVLAVVIASLGIAACDAQCKKSADVLLEVDGDDAVLAQVASVELSVAADGGPVQAAPLVMTGPLKTGATILLSALSTPSTPTYSVTISASLRNGAGLEIATGTTTATVGSRACNHVRLSVVAAVNDMSVSLDLSTSPSADLACVPNGYDEDGDGIPDPCDVCAATFDPADVDTDSDGVPDKCDPAPMMKGNSVTLFEPFNTVPPMWTGTAQLMVTGGYLVVKDLLACMHSVYYYVGIGSSVQLQTYVTPTVFSASYIADVRLFVLDAGDTASGMSCVLRHNNATKGTTLVLSQGAIAADPNSSTETQPTSTSVPIGSGPFPSRLVLTVSGGTMPTMPTVSCALLDPSGAVMYSVFPTHVQFSPTNLLPGVGVCYASATFSSLFGVSAP